MSPQSTEVVSHFQFLNSFTGFLLILQLKRCMRNKNIFATESSYFTQFHQLINLRNHINLLHLLTPDS